MKKLLFSLLILSFATSSNAQFDGTVIDTDIAVDTIWTKSMSPIFVKGIDEKDTNLMIVNGATLKIEPGVEIFMQKGMNFIVTNQCLKGYGSRCFEDSNGEKTFPQLIAKGTISEPIILTSEKNNGVKKRWGNFILESKFNKIEFVNFSEGGIGKDNYFIKLGKDTFFENNIIKNIGNNAVFLKNIKFQNNVINNANGNGIFCERKCEIENVAILNVKGNAIIADKIEEKSYIKNNFIYGNDGSGFQLNHYFNKDFIISNNEFINNFGGINIYHNNTNIIINNNNFIKNRDFAIKTDTQDFNFEIFIKGNFFNIDTGPQNKIGEFFVGNGLSSMGFKVEKNNFSFPKNGVAFNFYENYLKNKGENTDLFEIFFDRKIVIGKINQAGGIIEYEFSFKNLKTKTVNNIDFELNIPNDQEIILCSISENSSNYSFKKSCTNPDFGNLKFEGKTLKWKIDKIGALKNGGKINFSTLIKASKEGKNNAKNINIILKNNLFKKEINYKISQKIIIKKSENNFYKKEIKIFSKQVGKQTFKKITRAELLKRKKEAENLKKENKIIVEKSEQKIQKTKTFYLETGVIFTKIIDGKLYFYLKSENGAEFKLLNSSKWEDLVKHIRSEIKNKKMRVYGEYYINKFGNKIGINFNHFHLK